MLDLCIHKYMELIGCLDQQEHFIVLTWWPPLLISSLNFNSALCIPGQTSFWTRNMMSNEQKPGTEITSGQTGLPATTFIWKYCYSPTEDINARLGSCIWLVHHQNRRINFACKTFVCSSRRGNWESENHVSWKNMVNPIRLSDWNLPVLVVLGKLM